MEKCNFHRVFLAFGCRAFALILLKNRHSPHTQQEFNEAGTCWFEELICIFTAAKNLNPPGRAGE